MTYVEPHTRRINGKRVKVKGYYKNHRKSDSHLKKDSTCSSMGENRLVAYAIMRSTGQVFTV